VKSVSPSRSIGSLVRHRTGSRRGRAPFAPPSRARSRPCPAQAALAGDVGGEVGRKAVGVVERNTASPGICSPRGRRRSPRRCAGPAPACRRSAPPRSSAPARRAPAWRPVPDRRRPSAPPAARPAVEERLLLAELVAVANGAADDAPLHIATALVAGRDAVDHQEGRRSGCDRRSRAATCFTIGAAGGLGRGIDQAGTGRCRSCCARPASPRPGAPGPCRCRPTGCGSGVSSPSASRSYCMKTRFQIST
jgi:hypothetical protein